MRAKPCLAATRWVVGLFLLGAVTLCREVERVSREDKWWLNGWGGAERRRDGGETLFPSLLIPLSFPSLSSPCLFDGSMPCDFQTLNLLSHTNDQGLSITHDLKIRRKKIPTQPYPQRPPPSSSRVPCPRRPNIPSCV